MNRKSIFILTLIILLGIAAGCEKYFQNTAIPENTGSEPQISTPSDAGDTSGVSKGPPVEEYYDPNQPEQKIQMVYVNSSGTTYHRAGCKNLGKDKVAISLDEAKEEGYTPCAYCKPPQ